MCLAPFKDGPLRVYRPPEAGRSYVIGADVGSGRGLSRESGFTEKRRTDPSVAEVFDHHTLEQCAEWHGPIPPDVFAAELYRLGEWYNTAFLAVEANSEGQSTIAKLTHDLAYPRLYFRERHVAVSQNVNFDVPGWWTGGKSKNPIVQNLAKHIRDKTVIIHSPELLDEMASFIFDPTARGEERYRADKGCRDDRVMAAAIALYVRDSWQAAVADLRPDESSIKAKRERAMNDIEDEEEDRETAWFLHG